MIARRHILLVPVGNTVLLADMKRAPLVRRNKDGTITPGRLLPPLGALALPLPSWAMRLAEPGLLFRTDVDCRPRMPEIGILLPNNQRQHRTLHIQKDVLPSTLC